MIAVVAGARPNAVKVAPTLRELSKREVGHYLVWTGQHRGALDICEELGMETPQVRISLDGIEPSGYLDRIAGHLTEFWACEIARGARPSAVVVVGDVTSTLAAALAATAHGIPVVHVEAGLRSGDWTMPEERNRAIVDRMSDLLLCTEKQALERCLRWASAPIYADFGRPCCEFVGNVMIDSLRWAERKNDEALLTEVSRVSDMLGMTAEQLLGTGGARRYALVTLHRPSNVDSDAAWDRTQRAVTAIVETCEGMDVCWVRHPRWARRSVATGPLAGCPFLRMLEPQSYLEMVGLMKGATLVATDSGGVQEETTALGVPCLTLRENTERPITVTEGTNTVVGLDPLRIVAEVSNILAGNGKRGSLPEGWDGHAAERIVEAIARRYL